VVLITGMLQVNSEDLNQITDSGPKGDNSWLIYAIIGVGVVGAIGLFFFFTNAKFKAFCMNKLTGFLEGLKSIWTMEKKWAFIGHTIFIWSCYVGGIWIFAQAFPQTSAMEIGCVFGAFVVGATAIALLPGGIGVYPLWIYEVLKIYEIDFAGYSIFIWVTQTAMLVLLGLLSLFLIQRQPKLSNS
jgi:uncharacterized membrane protein YbhN (UPF0104 family)